MVTAGSANAGGLSCKYKNVVFVGGADVLTIGFPPGPALTPIFTTIQLDLFEEFDGNGFPKYTPVIFEKDKKSNLAIGKTMPYATFVAKSADAQVIVVTITGKESQTVELGNSAGEYEGVMTHINRLSTHVFEVSCFGLE